MDENDILTTLDLGHAWGVERHVAQRRAARWEQRLGLTRVPARSPSGHPIFAYSRIDAERIITAQREHEARRETNASGRNKKATEIEYEIRTANRSDVMTVHELAGILKVSRPRASQIARRLEGHLGIQRVEARAASTQKIIAYRRSDGEHIVNFSRKGVTQRSLVKTPKKNADANEWQSHSPPHHHQEKSFFI